MYRKLDPEKTIGTISVLYLRINERFPNSSLSKVCDELIGIAKECQERAEKFAKPNWWLRIFLALTIIFSVFVLVYSSSYIKVTSSVLKTSEVVQVFEAGINNIILIGAAIIILFSVEARIKRGRALTALYELRAIAHVIDMHQLTKDPSKIMTPQIATPSSPKTKLDAYQIIRYLNYSSEMLSLVGKIAALYAENFKDATVLAAVNEIEIVTTGLSQKIWQKIIILNKLQLDQQ